MTGKRCKLLESSYKREDCRVADVPGNDNEWAPLPADAFVRIDAQLLQLAVQG